MHNLIMRRTWDDILALASQKGMITPSDVRSLGLAPENLNRLADLGKLERIGRGLYRHPDFAPSEYHSYVEVARAVPAGVLCLLSALSVHGIGSQMPWQVWVAIPRGKRVPVARQTQLRVVTMSGLNYQLGLEQVMLEGVSVRVYSLEKTIVDCFRLRRLVGHEVGVEALRDGISNRRIDVARLVDVADQLRSRRLIQPCVEALL